MAIRVLAYKRSNGRVPLLEWLDGLPLSIKAKCWERIRRLEQQGHRLGPPAAKPLAGTNGLLELRVNRSEAAFRMIYFFDRGNAIVTHGFEKGSKATPSGELNRAYEYQTDYGSDPERRVHPVEDEYKR